MSFHVPIFPHPIVRDDKMQEADQEKYSLPASAANKSY
jgi:hypothetical protein